EHPLDRQLHAAAARAERRPAPGGGGRRGGRAARAAPGDRRGPGRRRAYDEEEEEEEEAMSTGIDESRAFVPVRSAVLTVSDTRDEAEDRSGKTLVERATAAGHTIVAKVIVKDDRAAIEAQLRAWIDDPKVQVVI